jgi:hypothetical protein
VRPSSPSDSTVQPAITLSPGKLALLPTAVWILSRQDYQTIDNSLLKRWHGVGCAAVRAVFWGDEVEKVHTIMHLVDAVHALSDVEEMMDDETP